ncbi:MAG: hypothetical protein HQ475_11785 [SAR202 cluster bacterium]|nr:hypothetical protein [SAR202 cluster bacterium]
MGREAFRSLYGDLTKLKDDSLLKDPASGAGDDDELFQLLLAVSDWVDHYCNRHFYSRTDTLVFNGTSTAQLMVPDLISITSLKEDSNGDLAFNETWAASDYWLQPYNASPSQHWGSPYTVVRARSKGDKSDGFIAGEQNFQIIGLWGYVQFAEDSGTDLNDAAMTTTKTTVAVDDGTQFNTGQTILIGTEQMLVTAISGNDLTVSRGLNGTTAVAHADNSDLSILRWPASVERATLVQAARIWTRSADFEPFFVDADVDTDVRLLLEPFRKAAA